MRKRLSLLIVLMPISFAGCSSLQHFFYNEQEAPAEEAITQAKEQQSQTAVDIENKNVAVDKETSKPTNKPAPITSQPRVFIGKQVKSLPPMSPDTADKATAPIKSAIEEKTEPKIIETTQASPATKKPAEAVKKPITSAKVVTKVVSEQPAKPAPTLPAKTEEATAVKSTPAPTPAKTTLKGQLKLNNQQGKIFSANGALVSLTAIAEKHKRKKTPGVHMINTRDKKYMPEFINVNVGDKLVFKNSDTIKHNVFSSSGKNTFDLGTYGYNKEREHTVTTEGIIKVYCNIHPEMALFISAEKTPYSQVLNDSGTFQFKQIPHGKYLLKVWHLRGSLEKKIEVTQNTDFQDILISTSSYKPKPHLNKYGKKYKKQPPIFKDEFY